jgi:hypothetical protein
MKKFIFIIFTILSINCAMANGILDNIENSLYGFTYSNSDDATRLSRIEKSVYGQEKSGSTTERLNSLKKDMSADLIGQEIEPKEDTFLEEQDKYKELAEEKIPPSNVDYPSINELEKQVFNKEFKTEDLNSRLAKLEKQVFGETYNTNSFSERVDKLQAKVKPKSFMDNSLAQSSNDFYDNDVIPLEKNYTLDEYKAPDFDYESYNAKQHSNPIKIGLSTVEKSIFKRSFQNDSPDVRLSRLESTMFGTTFNSDSQEARLQRIASAYKATKTASKYDSNKFSQNMATAMQIGTIILMILACVL